MREVVVLEDQESEPVEIGEGQVLGQLGAKC